MIRLQTQRGGQGIVGIGLRRPRHRLASVRRVAGAGADELLLLGTRLGSRLVDQVLATHRARVAAALLVDLLLQRDQLRMRQVVVQHPGIGRGRGRAGAAADQTTREGRPYGSA